MKHLKYFEDTNPDFHTYPLNKIIKYKVGDYVVIDTSKISKIKSLELIIGKILEIDKDNRTDYTYAVELDDGNGWSWIKDDEILFSSTNEKDVEMYINANKYNL